MADNTRDIEIRVKAKEETAGVFAKVREEMEQLKKSTGRGSALGEFGELLKGAGVAFGITEIAKVAGEAAEKASEINEQLAAGEISAAQMKEQLLEQIPVFGEVVSAVVNIREYWTSVGLSTKLAKEESEELDKAIERQNELLCESKRLYEQNRLEVAAIRGETALVGQHGLGGELAKSLEAERQQVDAIKSQTDQKIDDQNTQHEAQLRQLHQEKEDLQERIAEAQANDSWAYRHANPGSLVALAAMQSRLQEVKLQEKLESQHVGDQAKIAAEGQSKIAAIQAKGYADRREIGRVGGIEIENMERESAARIAATQAQARQLALRETGNELGAELDEIQTSMAAQIEAIKRAADAAKEKNPERGGLIDQEKQREEAAVRADAAERTKAAQRKAANDQKDKEFQVESVAASARIESLRAEAELGSTAKQIELERAEIAEKYREKREEISKQLREDLTLTQQQRQTLQQTLSGLDAQEKREEAIAALKRASKFELAQSDTDREVSGVGLAFRAKLSAELADKIGNAQASGPGGAGVGAAFAGGVTGKPGAAAAENTAANTSRSADLLSQLLQSFNQNFQQLIQQIGQNSATAQPIFQN